LILEILQDNINKIKIGNKKKLDKNEIFINGDMFLNDFNIKNIELDFMEVELVDIRDNKYSISEYNIGKEFFLREIRER